MQPEIKKLIIHMVSLGLRLNEVNIALKWPRPSSTLKLSSIYMYI